MNRLRWTLIGSAVIAAIAASFALAHAQPRDQKPGAVADLAWLQGRWIGELGDGVAVEETWSPPAGGTMVGMYRQMTTDETSLFELMSLEAGEDGAPVLRIRHFHPGLVPWESEKDGPLECPLIDLGPRRAAFEAPPGSGIGTFSYMRNGNTLRTTIAFVERERTPWIIKFELAD